MPQISFAQRLQPHILLRWSIAVAALTIVLKTLAWWLTGSVGLLSDAMESVVNLAGAAFALLMVKIAARPADEDHPYGHHKAEYFSAGFEGLLIIVAAAGIIWTAVCGCMQPAAAGAAGHRPAAVGREFRHQRCSGLADVAGFALPPVDGAGRRCAPPVHRCLDVRRRRSAGVGLVAHFTHWLWLDPVVAIAVAANILREGVHLMWKSSRGPDGRRAGARGADGDRPDPGAVQAPHDPLRPPVHAPLGPAPLRRPAHAHAGRTGRSAARRPCAPPSSRR